MKITNLEKIRPKKLIVFDLDGTIAPTKSPMDKEMAALFASLLKQKKVAAISGAKLGLFNIQLLRPLSNDKNLFKNLFLFPTTATTFLRYKGGWHTVYSHTLSQKHASKVMAAFEKVFQEIGYRHPKKTYGKVIENRGSQITFSALGQDVVKKLGKRGVYMKEKWTRENTLVKMKIARLMAKYVPELEVRAAGFTSIDVTKKGIDKAYGIYQIEKHLKVKIKDMLFIGDAIFPGGNDYAVVKTNIDYIPVKGPEDTKKIIKFLLKN